MVVPRPLRRLARTALRQGGIRALVHARVLPRLPTAAQRVLPDFIIIGGQKCGTTSLDAYLRQHPCVLESLYKEVHFFDLHHAKGLDWYRAHFPLQRQMQHLREAQGTALTGESTPSYLFHPPVPARLRETLPRVRLIAILRNPIDRAHSHWQQIRDWREEGLTFEKALEAEPARLPANPETLSDLRQLDRWLRYSYLARGLYADQLERWFACFPRDQMLVMAFDDLKRDAAAVCRQVTGFLGLPPLAVPLPKTASRPRDAMAPETRARLQAYFRPHNERLYALLGRDLGWD